jgi:hypothetical protein
VETGRLDVVERCKVVISRKTMDGANADFVEAFEEVLVGVSRDRMRRGNAHLSDIYRILDFLRSQICHADSCDVVNCWCASR